MKWVIVLILIFYVTSCYCDIYFHNPRGSNNRLNEDRRDRQNANRLFDSQNNARGGYNVGNIYYFVDSKVAIEWTNQHSCGDENNRCEIVVQYMSHETVRDGTSTTTIPENPNECLTNGNSDNAEKMMDCNRKFEYGMHEDFYYYARCKYTQRNKGLFTADQNLNMKYSAKHTRQNRNGNRYGYECPEERDYYPYWRSSPWIDVVVMTDDVKKCEMYQRESQNVKPRGECEVPYQYLYQMMLMDTEPKSIEEYIPITEEECAAFKVKYIGANGLETTGYGKWINVSAHGVDPPDCVEAPWSRDNHNGNGAYGHPNSYNWTVPNHPSEKIILRIRYNITTGETKPDLDYRSNNRIPSDGPGPDIYSQYNLTYEEAKERGYNFKNNQEVDIYNLRTKKGMKKFDLKLALNTAQYGRVFQDRSHRLAIRKKPESLDCGNIVNVNVRGKRGNIVQVYPAVEYDFIPNTVRVLTGDCVHFQWTGSDNNNNNNDGQGRAGTDRSNVVPLRPPIYDEKKGSSVNGQTFGHWGRSYPLYDLSNSFFSEDVMTNAATLSSNQFGGNMAELDDAGTYFDLGPHKVTKPGTHNYMCTRNNNFSNRSQKGKLYVSDSPLAQKVVGELGGTVAIDGKITSVHVEPGVFEKAVNLQLEHHPMGNNPIGSEPNNKDYVSGFVSLGPSIKFTKKGKFALMKIELDKVNSGLFDRHVYRTTDGETWYKLEVIPEESDDGHVGFNTDEGGHFVVSRTVAAGPMAGLVIGLLAALILLVVLFYLCRTQKLPLAGYNSKI